MAGAAPSPRDADLVATAKLGVRALLANVRADANAEGKPWTLGLEDAALGLRVYHSEVPGSALLRFKGAFVIVSHNRLGLGSGSGLGTG